MTTQFDRNYDAVLDAIQDGVSRSRTEAMTLACDLFWEHFGDEDPERPKPGRGISWIGFYEMNDARNAMTLAVRRDKPACSPIELHGACGRAALERASLLVPDINTLGENYIACDPRDASELVIPMLDEHGESWGVLDADSYATNAFSEIDIERMTSICARLKLTHTADAMPTLRL